MTETRNWTYGCFPPVEGSAEIRRQLIAASRYRNNLVAVEREARKRYRDERERLCPGYVEAEDLANDLSEQLSTAKKEMKELRAASRSRVVDVNLKARIDDLTAKHKEARAKLGALRDSFKDAVESYQKVVAEVYPEYGLLRERNTNIKARIKELTGAEKTTLITSSKADFERMAEIRAAINPDILDQEALTGRQWYELDGELREIRSKRQRELRAENGLYWPTGGLIDKAHEAVMKKRGGDPEFQRTARCGHQRNTSVEESNPEFKCMVHNEPHEEDEEDNPSLVYQGRVGGQIQKRGGSFMTFQEALDCTSTQFRLERLPEADLPMSRKRRRKRALFMAWLRIGSTPEKEPLWAKLRVFLNRTPPPDTLIKYAWIKVSHSGTRYKYELQLTLCGRIAKTVPHRSGTLYINWGWRLLPNGDIRVAYGIDENKKSGSLVLPAWVKQHLDQVKNINSIRDKSFNLIKARLAEWLKNYKPVLIIDDEPLPEWLKEATEHIDLWKSKNRLAELVYRWKENRFRGDEQLFIPWNWRGDNDYGNFGEFLDKNPKIIALEEWRKQDRHLLQYADGYANKARNFRKDLYRKYADKLRVYSKIVASEHNIQQSTRKESGLESIQIRIERIAATAELRRYIQEVAAEFVELPSKELTLICNQCKQKNEPNTNLITTCSSCNTEIDQDLNHVLNLMERERSGGYDQKQEENESSAA